MNRELIVTSPAFVNDGVMPIKHTGFGEDISPGFSIKNMCCEVVSIAITMDDLDIPFTKEFNHWIIWNIPANDIIEENILYGATVERLNNAVQGVGYGHNRYRGPKQPVFVRKEHRYLFRIYGLDSYIDLPYTSRKEDLIQAMQGHILQTGSITGRYKRLVR